MNPVERSEILPLGEYESIRERFRARILEDKRHRRAPLGEIMTALFENHDTVLMQIQEMLRTERITNEAGIAHEIETYNELVPGDNELSLTLFIEVDDKAERDRKLVELAGVEERVSLEIGGERFAARAADRDGAEAGRTTAVQYHKIPLSSEAAERLRKGEAGEIALRVDHPSYTRRAVLAADVAAQLRSDLSWSS